MKTPETETAVFGGKLCIRSGFKWVSATPADLERIHRIRASKRDDLWLGIATALAIVASAVALAREVL